MRNKQSVTFISGNQNKADYLARYLGFPVSHTKLDLPEIQSLDLKEIVEHKVRAAYELVQAPVLVEDVALEFDSLGGLPGPFIKFFVAQVPLERLSRMVDGAVRTATARCVFGYCDGVETVFFEGQMRGQIAESPQGEGGFGWDKIFIPEGYSVTRAALSAADDEKTYCTIKPFAALKAFLESKVVH
jgi:inosine triphosphate pyrophosphatase